MKNTNIIIHGPNVSDPIEGYAKAEAELLKNKILSSENTEKQYSLTGTRYYFSQFGDDNNTGIDENSPFKSIELIDGLNLHNGDSILFERGSLFRLKNAVVLKSGVTYGSYGSGDKPTFYTSPLNFADDKNLWKKHDENVWVTEFNYEPASGIVIDDGKLVGRVRHIGNSKKNENGSWYYDGVPVLTKNGDIYHDFENGLVYLYCDVDNPATIYNSIEIMPRVNAFCMEKGAHCITVDNICFKYTGGFPLSAADSEGTIAITNCEIGYSGGLSNGSVRFGNAFEMWINARNVKFENNYVYQTFDSAITWQGNRGDGEYKNISFCNNLFEYNNADIEFFERKGSTLRGFYMENNIMRFTSMGWGTRSDDDGIRGIEGCVRARTIHLEEMSDVTFKNNIIDCPARQIINWNIAPWQKNEITAVGNKIFYKQSCRSSPVALQGLQKNADEPIDNQFNISSKEEFEKEIKRFEDDVELIWNE